jgi:hypothetical protein
MVVAPPPTADDPGAAPFGAHRGEGHAVLESGDPKEVAGAATGGVDPEDGVGRLAGSVLQQHQRTRSSLYETFPIDSIRSVARSCELSIWREGRKASTQKKLNCWKLHGYGCVPCIDLPTQSASSSLLSVSPPGRSPALSVSSLSPAPMLPMQGPGGHNLTFCIPAPADKAASSLLALASSKVTFWLLDEPFRFRCYINDTESSIGNTKHPGFIRHAVCDVWTG